MDCTQSGLRRGKSLFSRGATPLHRFRLIRLAADAQGKKLRKIIHRLAVSVPCRLTKPMSRLAKILPDPLPDLVGQAQHVLGLRVILFGRTPEPVDYPFVVPFNPDAVVNE